MDPQDFVKKLNEAQEFMKEEEYKKALILLEQLKETEKKGEFDYSLTHKLYQLISNSHSLYNQKIILSKLKMIDSSKSSISFLELNKMIKNETDLDLNEMIVIREIEILILRGLVPYKIKDNKLIF